LQVDPGKRIHALYTRENSTLTFVPATGALNAAFAYRPLYDKKPAPGVSGLAGRMCFDIWGGTYGQIRDRMREAVRLGLVDSFLTVHNWQRWGYDYRLPDVWPPNPKYGTIEDLQELGRVCREQSIPWGLHDNYIDFYPDAEDYSYKHVYFTKSGEPHKAWHNRGREAYSYKWRPDAILPFVKRNLKQIRRDVAPTHSFLDVFTSTGCVDWWDWEGNHHPSTETRKLWGETFAWIRDCLGDDAPTTSEGGHDQLTGYLDGADCQWLTLAQKGRRFVIGLPCGDWERVPWFDAVNHTNFVLHGVGYSSRYAAERSRAVHGINSDDYMSCEVLSGHALMVDSSSWGRAAARKYYLLQDVARRLALRNIRSVDFVGGDIHRQRVVWDDGTEVFVNRGTSDWPVAGRTLPGYGFLVRKGVNFATVERVNGMFAESSRGESGWFCNARTVSAEREHRVFARPFVENFRHRGSGEITYDLSWNVARGNANNWRAFVHFYDTLDEEKGKIIFQDDHTPSVPVKEWEAGVVRTSRTLAIPDGLAGTFEMTAGLYSPEGGRALLSGVAVGSGRMHLGTLCVERNGEEVSQVSLRPPDGEATEPELPPTNPTGTTIDFGFARTSGAFRVQPLQGGLRVTPLPRSKTFPITLRLDALTAGASPRVKSIVAVPVDETATTAEHAFEQEDGELTFTHDPSTFAYDVQW
ncbi:MAG: hypothetical protein HON70_09085, partial [Lentisphaerae bacterium]|nr:hypothetical protein [Lentisphaerota bacterium]